MESTGELFMRPREGYFGVYFPSCEATREINIKIALEWAHKEFITRVETLFHFTLWCHKYITWHINYGARTRKAISNSSDIDFNHSHVYGRMCEKDWPMNRSHYGAILMWNVLIASAITQRYDCPGKQVNAMSLLPALLLTKDMISVVQRSLDWLQSFSLAKLNAVRLCSGTLAWHVM